MLTFDEIKELVNLVAERQLQGLEIERSGFRVKIEGRPSPHAVVAAAAPPAARDAAAVSAPPAALDTVAAAPAASKEGAGAPAEPAAPDGHVLTSPIVGTFYTAASPDADPYVGVGASVKKGQVLCIVEAMKLMNEIESDVDGVIEEVYPKNAQPVEFGEPLFRIRTS